jgi:hypothetical protein
MDLSEGARGRHPGHLVILFGVAAIGIVYWKFVP